MRWPSKLKLRPSGVNFSLRRVGQGSPVAPTRGPAMLPAIVDMTLPDMAAILLVSCVPLLLVIASWRFVAPRGAARSRPTPGRATSSHLGGTPLGLAGQWLAQERRITSGIDRQTAAVRLHQQVALQIGALDYEIDRLWRETRALGSALDRRPSVNSFYPSAYTRRPNVPGSAAFLTAGYWRRPEAMAS